MTGAVEAQASQTQFSGVHAALTGLAADDHLQYALLAGRALGQTLIGDTVVGGELVLQGSVAGANRGLVRMNSPLVFDDVTDGNALSPYSIADISSQSFTAGFVGGGFNASPTISFTNGFFIWEALRGAPVITSGVNPGFAAFALFQALTNLDAGSGATFDPLNALVLNAGVGTRSAFTGSRTASTLVINGSPSIRPQVSGAVLNWSTCTGFQFSPVWSTVAGSTANLGAIVGFSARNPAQALFGSSAGVETMTSYYAMDVAAISFGGDVPKAALRSAIAAASNARFLNNIGTAESEFGAGDIHFNDGSGVKFGNTLAAPDILAFWDGASAELRLSTFFGTGGNPIAIAGTAADEWIFRGGAALPIGIGFNVPTVVFGTTLPTPNSNNWFVQFAGPNLRAVQLAGEYSDVLWTASGSIDVAGFAVTDLQAFKINSPAVLLNGGTIDDISNLFVQAMPSFGATRTQALRVLGRGRIDGHINQGSQSPAQILANQNDYSLAANNGQRGVALLDSDDNYNITGIDSSFGFGQDGDLIKLINIGAFNLTLTHEDAASLAANRFLRANALDLVLAPGDTIEIWKDDTATDRWRILETIATGAGLLSGPWSFSTATGAADPGAGRLRYDNATPASVTNVYIDQLTDTGGDAQNILSALASGDQLYIQDQRDAANFLVFDITSVTDNVGWFTIGGTVNASGGLPSNNRVLTVSARFA